MSSAVHSWGSGIHWAAYGAARPLARPVAAAGYTLLAEMLDADTPAVEPTVVKTSHLRSPGRGHEFIAGMIDSGEVRVRHNYFAALMIAYANLVPGSTANPATPANANGNKMFLMELPDLGTIYFEGFVKGLPVKVQEDDRIELEVSIKVSGVPILYAIA